MAKSRARLILPARPPTAEQPERFEPVTAPPLADKPSLLAAMDDVAKVSALLPDPATLIVILKRHDVDTEFCYQLMRCITQHPTLFETLFPTETTITQIAEEQKAARHCAGIAINYVIKNEEQFARIVNCKAVLKNLANVFPCHATIFKQPTIHSAKIVSKTKAHLFELLLVRKRLATPYQSLPKPILLQIAAYASVDHGKQEAYELATKTFKLSH